MKQEDFWLEFSALPPQAQQMVVDFIDFLKERYESVTVNQPEGKKLADEDFIGMWQDRDDMKVSRQWIRDVRQREWGSVID